MSTTEQSTDMNTIIADAFERAEAAQEVQEPEAQAEEAQVEEIDADVEATAEDDTTDDTLEAEDASEEDGEEAEEVVEMPALDMNMTVPVKINGQIVEKTLQDLVNAESGREFNKQEIDRTKETQRQVQEALVALQEKQQQVLQFAAQIEQNGLIPQPQRPEWNAADPIGSMEARDQYERQMDDYNAQQAELRQAAEQQNTLARAQQQRYQQEQMQRLTQKIPDFADPQKAQALSAELNRYAAEAHGYSPEELGGVNDHRALVVLHKAMQFDKLMAEGREKSKPKARPVKTASPRKETLRATRKKQLDKAAATGNFEALVDAAFANLE